MSQGNLAAQVGVANTSKVPFIGVYAQNSGGPSGPDAYGGYVGVNGTGYWSYNPVDEDFAVAGGIVVASNSGAAAGKDARLVKNTAALTVSADQTCAVSAGGVATAATGGAYKTGNPTGLVIPINSFFWVFVV